MSRYPGLPWLLCAATALACAAAAPEPARLAVTLQSDGQHCLVREAIIPCDALASHLRDTLRLPAGTLVQLRAGRAASPEAVRGVLGVIDASGFGPGTSISPATPEARLRRHVEVLSSDDFEGREPGTRSEALTVRYIEREMRAAGLAPQGKSFRHAVPLLRLSARATLEARVAGGSVPLPAGDVIVQALQDTALDGREEVVFAGHGIDAPEAGWSGLASPEFRNRIVVMLDAEPATLVEDLRRALPGPAGEAVAENGRTYNYWLWVKQIRAAQWGARALVVVAPDARIARRRAFFEQDYMLLSQGEPWQPPLTVQMAESIFSDLLSRSGQDLATLKQAAAQSGFRAHPLAISLSGRVAVSRRPLNSRNVVGRIRGREPGCVVVTAHWDGYGVDPGAPAGSDNIWNGAVDDAGGVSQLIEMARDLASRPKPLHSIIFAAVTGEERGFLGSRQLLADMGCATPEIAAAINLDYFYELGRTRRFASHGLGYSSLDDWLAPLVARQDRTLTAVNAMLAGGDQLPFVLAGIPAIHGGSTLPLRNRPVDFEEQYYARRDEQAVKREGNSSEDEIRPEWDLAGAVEDLEVMTALTWRAANDPQKPCWRLQNGLGSRKRQCAQVAH